MMIPYNAAAATAAPSATADTHTPSYVCATLFPGASDTEAVATYSAFLKRKRADMSHYASAAKNAMAFFATSSRTAFKSDTADYDTLRRIAADKFKRQRADICLDKKRAAAAYASASADTARRAHTIATAAMKKTFAALQSANHLVDAGFIVAKSSPHIAFTLSIDNMGYLQSSHIACKRAVVAAYTVLADALLALYQATEVVKTAEADARKVLKNETDVVAMLARHQTVSSEYAADALKIQQDMEALFEEREYADNADFALLTRLVEAAPEAARCGKRRCPSPRSGGGAKRMSE